MKLRDKSEPTIHYEEFPFDEIEHTFDDGIARRTHWRFTTIKDAKEYTGYDESHIWSITESDGTRCYGPSHHYVNLIGYVVTHEAHDGNTYYEEKDWREQEELAEAEETITNALVCFAEDCISDNPDEIEKIDDAWALIKEKLKELTDD